MWRKLRCVCFLFCLNISFLSSNREHILLLLLLSLLCRPSKPHPRNPDNSGLRCCTMHRRAYIVIASAGYCSDRLHPRPSVARWAPGERVLDIFPLMLDNMTCNCHLADVKKEEMQQQKPRQPQWREIRFNLHCENTQTYTHTDTNARDFPYEYVRRTRAASSCCA